MTKEYNLIFLRDSKLLLSKKEYSSWRDIQQDYENYIASLNFKSIDEIINYLSMEYNINIEFAKHQVLKIADNDFDNIELEVRH